MSVVFTGSPSSHTERTTTKLPIKLRLKLGQSAEIYLFFIFLRMPLFFTTQCLKSLDPISQNLVLDL